MTIRSFNLACYDVQSGRVLIDTLIRNVLSHILHVRDGSTGGTGGVSNRPEVGLLTGPEVTLTSGTTGSDRK